MTRTAIMQIQTGLRGRGFDPGPLDGVDGPKTRAAALAYGQGGAGRAAVDAIAVITRAVLYQGAARYPVDEIVLHCAATAPDWMAGQPLAAKKAEIDLWHRRDRGFKMIGYHWLIDRDGAMLACRPETQIGAHVIEANRGTIGICLIGGFGSAATDRFDQHFTGAQDRQLRQQILGISLRTQIARIRGHNHYAAKACPGFHVPTWFKGV